MFRTPLLAHAGDWVIECIDTLAGIDRLREDWQSLEARAADPLTYFQSYDWCRSWCSYYAQGDRGPCIRVYAGYLDGRLAAVWPLMLSGDRPFVRKLVALTEPHGQYGNILIDRLAASAGKIARLVECCLCMAIEQDKADAVIFESVPGSALPKQVASIESLAVVPVGVNSCMDLTCFEGRFDAYRASLNGKTRRARNKRRKKLAALGNLGYRVHTGGTCEYVQLVQTGITMKRQWLEETGRATRALNLPHVPEFLGALSNSPSGDNGAIAAALTLDGRPVAVEIGFLHHRRFYSYLGSFDWALRNYSPGKLQLEEALKWCLANGVETYDLLGAPGAYKSDWRNETEPLIAYRSANTLYGYAYLNAWCGRVRPMLKQSFERIPHSLRARLIPAIEKRHAAVANLAPGE